METVLIHLINISLEIMCVKESVLKDSLKYTLKFENYFD